MTNSKQYSGLAQYGRTAFIFVAALLAVGALIGRPNTVLAVDPSSVSINSATIVLLTDPNDNSIINIGDTVRVTVVVTNTDGGCVAAGTTVEADITKYGGAADEGLTCIMNNGGMGDAFQLNFMVADAGLLGIDELGGALATSVTVSATDADDPAPQTADSTTTGNPVDTIAPVVDAAWIYATGNSGHDSEFIINDHPAYRWDRSAESDTMVSVTVNGSDFRAGDTALVASVFGAFGEMYEANASGALQTIESNGNEVTVTATDDAGNSTTTVSDATYAIDTVAPAITQVKALLQNGSDPAQVANNWYYYPGQSVKFTATGSEPLSGMKACIQSLMNDDMADTCSVFEPNDFVAGTANQDYIDGSFVAGNEYSFEISTNWPDHFPTQVGGYPMNLYLVDAAGNGGYSTGQETSFGAVFNVNPKTDLAILNNAATTDWSTIADFTDATTGGPLVFNAQILGQDVGQLSFPGPGVNLTDQDTIDGLMNFGENVVLTASDGSGDPSIGLNSLALAALDMEANLTIWLDTAVRPGLVVRDNLGEITGYISTLAAGPVLIGGDTIDNIVWDGDAHSISFSTDGFSNFGADNTPPSVLFARITGPNAAEVVYDEPITGNKTDYTNFMITGELVARTVTDWGGNGTDTHSLTFDGAPVGLDATGTVDINNPGLSVTDMVGNELPMTVGLAMIDGQAGSAATTGGGSPARSDGGTPATPVVTVLRPNGGETYSAGAVAGIDWSSVDGAFVKYRIFYSADNGNTWSLVADNISNWSTSWTVPAISTTQGRIKVEGFDGSGAVIASDISDAAFTVNGTTAAPQTPSGAEGLTPPSNDPNVSGPYNANSALNSTPNINTDMNLPAAPPFTAWCVSGSLIKTKSSSAVFYCGNDGKRYVFVNDKAYFSWYPDFSTVQTINEQTMAEIAIGGNITYRPGSKMVKIQSDPKVYAIARGGILRWVMTEAIAVRLYGANWNTMIDDVSDAFFVNYVLGSPTTE